MPDRGEAEASKQVFGFGGQPQRLDRQALERRAERCFQAGRCAPLKARQRPGRAGRGRDGGAGGEALRGQAADKRRAHLRGVAKQMRAAGDVQKQTLRRIERHDRREALAPAGDVIQQFQIGFIFGHTRGKRGDTRARISEREARLESRFARGHVYRGERDAVAVFARRGERRVSRRGAETDQPLDRQARQPERDPCFLWPWFLGKRRHADSILKSRSVRHARCAGG